MGPQLQCVSGEGGQGGGGRGGGGEGGVGPLVTVCEW